MANQRVRLDSHIEDYLRSQAQRVLDKSADSCTGTDLTTLTNTIIYEHRLGHQLAKQVPFAKVFSWVMALVPGNSSHVMPLAGSAEAPVLKASPESFDFDADLGDLYEDEAA